MVTAMKVVAAAVAVLLVIPLEAEATLALVPDLVQALGQVMGMYPYQFPLLLLHVLPVPPVHSQIVLYRGRCAQQVPLVHIQTVPFLRPIVLQVRPVPILTALFQRPTARQERREPIQTAMFQPRIVRLEP